MFIVDCPILTGIKAGPHWHDGGWLVCSSTTLTKVTQALKKMCAKAIKGTRQKGRMTFGGPKAYMMIDESKFYHKIKVLHSFKSSLIGLCSHHYMQLFIQSLSICQTWISLLNGPIIMLLYLAHIIGVLFEGSFYYYLAYLLQLISRFSVCYSFHRFAAAYTYTLKHVAHWGGVYYYFSKESDTQDFSIPV